jgi:hypothetical protein
MLKIAEHAVKNYHSIISHFGQLARCPFLRNCHAKIDEVVLTFLVRAKEINCAPPHPDAD